MAKGKGSKRKTQTPAHTFPTYERWVDPFPVQPPTVRIFFGGLLLFFFDGKNSCEAGIHNTTHPPIFSPPHPQPHDFQFSVKTTGSPIPMSLPLPTSTKLLPGDIHIEVTGNAANPAVDGVYVFAPTLNPDDAFDRTDATIDPRDWRWLLDFEGPDLHDSELSKSTAAFSPKLQINNGLFYNNYRTKSKFKARRWGADRELGFVGESAAANIYLRAGGAVSVFIRTALGDIPIGVPLVYKTGTTYEVYITNWCRSVGSCAQDPGSGDPKRRNDFYLYYDLFDVPLAEQFEIICYERHDVEILTPLHNVDIRSTDPAPCGPGVGGGG